jgi:hypothetical protein
MQGVARYCYSDLPSSGQTILKVTNSDTMLDFPYLESISVTSVLLLRYH